MVQTSPIARPRAGLFSSPRVWQTAVLAALLLWLYVPILAHLVAQWRNDEDYGHGFFVPFFSAFALWQLRGRLARVSTKPSRSGFALLAFALGFLVLGQLGAEIFLERFSLLLVLAGLVVLFLGWPFLRAALFPWAFLLLMIPIPVILFNQITFPLQLLASRISASALELLDVPVGLEGNIIRLAAMPLDVAKECSGIRSLMSLVTLAIIYGYLMEKRPWVRWLLALTSVPIAIAANSVRIIGTGLLVQHGYADAARNEFHAAWGVVIFVIALLMLYTLHALVRRLWPEKNNSPSGSPGALAPDQRTSALPRSHFFVAVLMIAGVAIFLQAHPHSEVFPPRLPLQSFPPKLGTRDSIEIPIDQDTLNVLGKGEFLHRLYKTESDQSDVDLFIAYFPSQRVGETPHTPQHCLPGSGWTPTEKKRITLTVPGHAPFPVNQYVVIRNGSRKLVLYWFPAHGRGVASEYWSKYYLIKDSIQMNRSDGALVRIMIPMSSDEAPDAVLQRHLPFVEDVIKLLDQYIPR